MRKEFLIMMTFYIAGLVFVNYAEPAVNSPEFNFVDN